jgi:hypothetical protein
MENTPPEDISGVDDARTRRARVADAVVVFLFSVAGLLVMLAVLLFVADALDLGRVLAAWG